MKKLLVTIGLILPLFSNAAVIDDLFSSGLKGLDGLFTKHSISSSSKDQIKESIEAALVAISKDGTAEVDFNTFSTIIKNSKDSSTDILNFKRILAKKTDTLERSEIGDLVNGLVYIALSKGQSKEKFLTCDSCAIEGVSALGIKSLGRIAKVGATEEKLAVLIPTADSSITRHLKVKFRALGLGNYAEHAAGNIKKENKRMLAMFLGYLEKGNPEEMALAKAIVELNTDDAGNVLLLENNRLWKIFSFISPNKMESERRSNFIRKFTMMLHEITDEDIIDGSRNNNFKEYLKRKIEANPSLNRQFKSIVDSDFPCWGI